MNSVHTPHVCTYSTCDLEVNALREQERDMRRLMLKYATELWALRGYRDEQGNACLPPDDPGHPGHPGHPGEPGCP